MDSPGLALIIILILIVLNGVFSAGEFAIISSRKSRIREMTKGKHGKKAEVLLTMRENPQKFLSTVQIGITVSGTLASAIGGIFSIQYVEPVIRRIPHVGRFSDTIALVLVVFCLTYVMLVIGELVPKHIGIALKEKAALRLVPLFEFFSRIFFVLVALLNVSTALILRLLNLKPAEEEHVGEEEIKVLLEEGRSKGVFGRTEEELIHGVFNFVDRSIKEIMVPRPNIYAIDIDKPAGEITDYILENEFSRYPVYRDHLDNVVGIVYQKDISRYIWAKQSFDLGSVLKRPYFVPDTMKISVLFKDMQKRRVLLAVVVDEYGTTVGIVTMEDIMEELFGEIMDETDTDVRIERTREGATIADASISIRDLNNALNLDLPESPEYETLGGFVLDKIQGIAKGGEIVHQGDLRFTVVGIHGRRISKVKIEKKGRAPHPQKP